MGSKSFADHLAELEDARLVELLEVRGDVRDEPVPASFAQLEYRLSSPDSLNTAIYELTLDLQTVSQSIALLGDDATGSGVAALLNASESAVLDAVTELSRRGLVWNDGSTFRLPELLARYGSSGLGGGRPVAKIAKSVYADNLRNTAAALGVVVNGLRKPELIDEISRAMSDRAAMIARITALPATAARQLARLRHPRSGHYFELFEERRAKQDPNEPLYRAGLLLKGHGWPEVPREIALAAWLAEHSIGLPRRPELPGSGSAVTTASAAAHAAAEELLRWVTTLLDDAADTPLVALKKGGVGPRERNRLASRLAIPLDAMALCIDLTHEAGLLGEVAKGYAPTKAYPGWREADRGQRWAALAHAWFALDFAPTYRIISGNDRDVKEMAPPVPLASWAGVMRRAMLTAARDGASVRGAGRAIDWFAPAHGYPAEERDHRVAAAIREGEMLGVIAADRVSDLGGHLLASARLDDSLAELSARCAPLLPEAVCTVILQSDLTAVVSGQPSAAAATLLGLTAVNETRGAAGVWRFTPASIRAALDHGWQPSDLLAELATLSDREVPQPLEYLINDTARQHGKVRVRGVRSCVVAEPSMITELLHTRALTPLRLGRLADTVLTSQLDLDEVLSRLRAAGFAPVAEDADGVAVVEAVTPHTAVTPRNHRSARRPARPTAAELVGRLRSGSVGARR